MVVALEVSNDRVYAAYADCKIRVWRRTWDGTLKHVRVATIPSTGSYVRSYIAGKDKTVCNFYGFNYYYYIFIYYILWKVMVMVTHNKSQE